MKKLNNIVLPIFLSLLIYSCAEEKSNGSSTSTGNSITIQLEDSYILSDTPKIGQVTFKPESDITGSSYFWEIDGATISSNNQREITANFTASGEYVVTLNVDGTSYSSKIIIPEEIDYEIDLGPNHTIISDISGKKLYVYGDNSHGQLCISNNTSTLSTPRILLKEQEISSVALGNNHTLFSDNSHIYACGDNTYGQLGNGTTNEIEAGFITLDTIPENSYRRIFVSAGGGMSVAGTEYLDGNTVNISIYNWGYDEDKAGNSQSSPNLIVTAISRNEPLFATGNNFSIIRGTGSYNMFSLGVNDKWQLGRIAGAGTSYPSYIGGENENNPDNNENSALNITDMTSGYMYTPYGEEGDYVNYFQNNYFARIAAGDDFAMAIKKETTDDSSWTTTNIYNLYIWGNNENNILGISSSDNPVRRATALFNAYSSSPADTDINGVNPIQDEIIEIAAGSKSGFAISSSGTLYGWGDDAYSQLTSNKEANATNNLIYEISNPAGVTAGYQNIWAGGNRVIALAGDNNLYTWGDNTGGILGVDSSESIIDTPQKLFFSLETITQ